MNRFLPVVPFFECESKISPPPKFRSSFRDPKYTAFEAALASPKKVESNTRRVCDVVQLIMHAAMDAELRSSNLPGGAVF